MLVRSVSYKRIKGIAALILGISIGVAAYTPIGYIMISNLLITTITANTTATIAISITTTTTIVVTTTTTTSIDYKVEENR
ncbi:hypothetical protein P8C59_007049 [Phyllachora maydis]|uniref:Uncharacterized protein n=1 Tax=Phyllachora maydis TaxID=1825666 RepID=A0AAD9I9C1_9PEZI|nr:hypothetical protein P8C59_007049 [Phyllachora maydis]